MAFFKYNQTNLNKKPNIGNKIKQTPNKKFKKEGKNSKFTIYFKINNFFVISDLDPDRSHPALQHWLSKGTSPAVFRNALFGRLWT